jgi:hypothetical protein
MKIPCKSGTMICYDEDGLPYSLTLAEDTTIQGIPCKGDELVLFFMSKKFDDETNQIYRCTISKPMVFNGIHYRAGHELVFKKDGSLNLETNETEPGLFVNRTSTHGCMEFDTPDGILYVEPTRQRGIYEVRLQGDTTDRFIFKMTPYITLVTIYGMYVDVTYGNASPDEYAD